MFDKIKVAIDAIRNGEMVVVVDDEDRENEGDLVMAASLVDKDDVNFMAVYGKGLICVPLSLEYAFRFGLKPMVKFNTCRLGTNFTESVDYVHGVSTGISMSDRAKTICALSDLSNVKGDFSRPGHIFPIVAKEGGVFERSGHTEAAVDLMKVAGLPPVGVICEIIKEDGDMARLDDLILFKNQFGLKFISIKDILRFLST